MRVRELCVVILATAIGGPPSVVRGEGCGEDSIYCVTRLYGMTVERQRIAAAMPASRTNQTNSIGDLINCLRHLGLRASGFLGNPSDLRGVDDPLVLHFVDPSRRDIGHFVAARWDRNSGCVRIYDLSESPSGFCVTNEFLDRYWSGRGVQVMGPSSPGVPDQVALIVCGVSAVILAGLFTARRKVG